MEACRRVEVETSKLSLDLGLAIYHVKEAEARAEEAWDATAAAKDEAIKSVAEVAEWVDVLH